MKRESVYHELCYYTAARLRLLLAQIDFALNSDLSDYFPDFYQERFHDCAEVFCRLLDFQAYLERLLLAQLTTSPHDEVETTLQNSVDAIRLRVRELEKEHADLQKKT